jgi:hypothetical protein
MASVATNGKGSGARTKARSKAKPDAARPKAAEAPSAPAPESDGPTGSAAGSQAHICSVGFCPIGLALSAVQPLRPDAVEHLLVAGREFFLAMRTIVDARAEQFEAESTGATFEKIDVG